MNNLYQKLLFQLILTARPFDTQLSQQLTKYDLHRTEWAILNYLMMDENLSLIEIARELGMDKPNVTRAVKRLVEIGYVELYPSQNDRRKKMVKIKENSHYIYQDLRTTINAFDLEILKDISEKEQYTTYHTLKKMQQNLIKRAGNIE